MTITAPPASNDRPVTSPASRSALTALFVSTTVWIALGLGAGVFSREFTKAQGFPDGVSGQLALVHTHLLVLGALVGLVVLVLEKTFTLSASRLFRWFFWIYNAGVLLTGAMMTWHGILDVVKIEPSKAISGIAGAGHILIGAGFVLLLIALGKRIRRAA
ncbi:DUF2871 domain-containing protein [uncultured Microbacterium sp.]|uniref:DUF2871 domain-containing protein n=1 Tax=uncultured Microbacterium sp. TaxID=191216 RepID=UPI0025DD4E23|nr:DUF2871 domain-containing protein [uncultured Microbacterium sp.]